MKQMTWVLMRGAENPKSSTEPFYWNGLIEGGFVPFSWNILIEGEIKLLFTVHWNNAVLDGSGTVVKQVYGRDCDWVVRVMYGLQYRWQNSLFQICDLQVDDEVVEAGAGRGALLPSCPRPHPSPISKVKPGHFIPQTHNCCANNQIIENLSASVGIISACR